MNNDQLLSQITIQTVEARRLMLASFIYKRLGGTIAYGPLKGFRLNENQSWGQGDIGPKLLGLYEQELLERISKRQKIWDCVINLGAGDGYYGVGLVKSGIAARSICFEQSTEGQAALKVAVSNNSVADRVTILGRAEGDFLDRPELRGIDLTRTLIIIDIEGGEFSLLTPQILTRLRDAEMFIEMHGGFFQKEPDLEFRFVSQLKNYFACDVLATGIRDLSQIPELAVLGDSDRWLLCSEGRPYLMRWVHCIPNQNIA